MSTKNEEEKKTGPQQEDPGGAGGGGGNPLTPQQRSTKEEKGGCSTPNSTSRAGASSGAGRTPPTMKIIGKKSNVHVVHFDETSQIDSNDQALDGVKTLINPKSSARKDGSLGPLGKQMLTSGSQGHSPSFSLEDQSADGEPTLAHQALETPLPDHDMDDIEPHIKEKVMPPSGEVSFTPSGETANLPSGENIELSKKNSDEHPRGEKSKTHVSNKFITVNGKEYGPFNRQGWARYSKEELIGRDGFIRKMYAHEQQLYKNQDRFEKLNKERQSLAVIRQPTPQMRNQTRLTKLRMMHQATYSKDRLVNEKERKRKGRPDSADNTPGKKQLMTGGEVFATPPRKQSTPPREEAMEEDDTEQEDPEGRAYWAQFHVRANTCRIFSDTGRKLDDIDINYLSQKMVQKRDFDFPSVDDPVQLAESDKISVDRIGKSGKHIRLRLLDNNGISWWREFIESVKPIQEGSADRGHKYIFYGPGESQYRYFRVWLADGAVGNPETGHSLLVREITRGNPCLRGVDWSVRVVGADGGKMVVKLSLPSSTAYSLLESMQYRLRYGMDRLEIVPITRGGSIASAAALAPGVPVEGQPKQSEAVPAPTGETSKQPVGIHPVVPMPTGEVPIETANVQADNTLTQWRDNEDLNTTKWSDTSTDTVVDNRSIDEETANKMLEEVEAGSHAESRTDESPFRTDDPDTVRQNKY